MSSPHPHVFGASTEAEVVAAVRSYLARLSPFAFAAFPAGSPRSVETPDDVAELALALARERSGKHASPWGVLTLVPVEAYLARACTRLAQLQDMTRAGTRTAKSRKTARHEA